VIACLILAGTQGCHTHAALTMPPPPSQHVRVTFAEPKTIEVIVAGERSPVFEARRLFGNVQRAQGDSLWLRYSLALDARGKAWQRPIGATALVVLGDGTTVETRRVSVFRTTMAIGAGLGVTYLIVGFLALSSWDSSSY
jgi:hypothetical protein